MALIWGCRPIVASRSAQQMTAGTNSLRCVKRCSDGETGTSEDRPVPSATAPEGVVHIDTRCHCLLAPDYVVQFGHHSYNPTNEGAGVPATWHWDNLQPSPSTPFSNHSY